MHLCNYNFMLMKKINAILIFIYVFCYATLLPAQSGKPVAPAHKQPTNFQPENFQPNDKMLQGIPRAERVLPLRAQFKQAAIPADLSGGGAKLKVEAKDKGLPLFISGQLGIEKRNLPFEEQVTEYLYAAKFLMQIEHPEEEFVLSKTETDELGQTHFRMQQYYQDIPVYGGQVILHTNAEGNIHSLNGRFYPTPRLKTITPDLSGSQAMNIARTDLATFTTLKNLSDFEKQYVLNADAAPELIVFHQEADASKELLCWKITIVPNMLENWDYFIDAKTGAVVSKINNSCTFYPNLLRGKNEAFHHEGIGTGTSAPLFGSGTFLGGTTANAVDLKGITRSINVFEDAGDYVLLDVGRAMYDTGSDIPDNMSGVVLTLDAVNTNPSNDNFNANYIFGNSNNTWNNPKAVSAHFNAAESYEYYRGIHSRNSINSSGGNIVAFINVAESDGSDMDNAFWNGAAMFYGNGDQAFSSPLQKSLDTGGHEMTHGVVGSSAGLIYQGQAGALNESFADVFGVMIEPDDWKVGEDIVNPSVFPSGALRDLSNPHQGGTGLGSPGWQPAHMNEYQDLPFTNAGDNGGVHVNSGIPNRAFYLYATAVGNSDARKVYYRALTTYLTNQAQFIDCRLAVLQAATDLFGAGSNKVTAAGSAFDQVGITGTTGSGGTEDIESNTGEDFILLTNTDFDALYLFDGANFPIVSNSGILSRPSITDDGSAIVFVDDNNDLKLLWYNTGTGQYDESYLQNNPEHIWRNVAISKDGSKLAALTTDWDNYIFVYDFDSQQATYIEILNPTTQQGVFTNDVQYADFIEWDYSGEYLLYDAYNVLDDDFGNTSDYWDIGLIQVWNNASNDFGDGYVFKIFNGLPDNTGVGDPSFSKNSPNIIALDFIGDAENFSDFTILGVDIEAGEVGYIYDNDILGRPNYSIQDDALIFDALSQTNDEIIGIVNLNSDKITPAGDPESFITGGANWGVWFARGERDFTATEEATTADLPLKVSPNPFSEKVTVEFDLTEGAAAAISVYDLTGKLQFHTTETYGQGPQKVELNLGGLAAGAYFIHLTTAAELGVVRILKAE